jgi:hypothetical protein
MAEVTTQEYITKESPQIEAYKLGLLDVAKKVSETPINLPAMQVAGMSPQQQDALKMAGQGIGVYQPFLNTASQNYADATAGFKSLPQYGQAAVDYGVAGAQAYNPNSATQYMNPYQEQVTQNAMKEMQRQAAVQQQGLNAQAVKSGAFGGSRQGVQQTELGRNLYDIQSQRIFQDYANNYNQAQTASMNAFQNQQARAQNLGNIALGAGSLASGSATGIANVGKQTADLGQQTSGLAQGDTSFLYNIGNQQQAYQQKVLDAARQTSIQQQYEPYQRISFLSDIYKGAPSSQQTISQTSAPSPSMVSQIGGLGIAGLSAYNLFGGSGTGTGTK